MDSLPPERPTAQERRCCPSSAHSHVGPQALAHTAKAKGICPVRRGRRNGDGDGDGDGVDLDPKGGQPPSLRCCSALGNVFPRAWNAEHRHVSNEYQAFRRAVCVYCLHFAVLVIPSRIVSRCVCHESLTDALMGHVLVWSAAWAPRASCDYRHTQIRTSTQLCAPLRSSSRSACLADVPSRDTQPCRWPARQNICC